MIKVVAGAAGGPKWLVLYHLDCMLFADWFKDRQTPLFLVGASSGAWRFSCVAQQDPAAAVDRFRHSYIHQYFPKKPTAAEVTEKSLAIVDHVLGENGIAEILDHPVMRINIMTVRSKGLLKYENKILLAGLLGSAASNAISRKNLKYFYERALFYHPADAPPFFEMNEFPITKIPLQTDNFRKALLASGSIPYVMLGIKDIPGAPEGIYRDGGVVDYHPDLPFVGDDSIVLYPHYTDRIIPGWFDKNLSWRKPNPANMENVLLVSPSQEFVNRLPYRKIPDRNDFYEFSKRDAERVDYWNTTVDASKQIAEEFWDAVDSGKIRDLVKPMP